MGRSQIAVSTAVVGLIVALGAGTLAGSWATARTGRGIPILTSVPGSSAGSVVSFDDGFAPVVKSVLPAVVNVSSSRVIRTPGSTSPLFSDPLFRQFFGSSRDFQTPPSVSRQQSLGSGVIVNPDGYVLTNNHVIEGAQDIKVLLGDKREFQARVVGGDPKTDVAVLKVDAKSLPVAAFGDSSRMQVGNFVLAIGNPFGLNQTVTLGIVSATGRGGLGIEDYEDFIQTDAAINPGNSGGALIDSRGTLIGLNTAILSSGSGGNQGVGFAIPGNMARAVMDQILKNGKVTRGWLGVSVQPVSQDIARAFHLSETSGALISGIAPGSPAAKSGLQTGDVILAIDGQKINDRRALQLKIGSLTPGTNVKFSISRNGMMKDVDVKLGELPVNAAPNPGGEPGNKGALRGITAGELTPEISSELQLPAGVKGVVVTNVDPASAAGAAGIQTGDLIQEVNRQPVTSVDGFEHAMQSASGQPVLLLVERSGETSFLVVPAQ
jgi:serine protease Do